MDRLIAPNTVPFGAHDVAPSTGTPGMATDGNPATPTLPTIFQAYGWNMVSEEQRNAIIAAGLTPDGTNWQQLTEAIQLLGTFGVRPLLSRRPLIELNAGAGVYTVPTGVSWIRIRAVAGGGGGASASNTTSIPGSGGGGGGGGYAEGWVQVTPGQQIAYSVGAGGAPGQVPSATGGQGGSTTFGSFLSLVGGSGGVGPAASTSATAGGQGGAGSAPGLLVIFGGAGNDGGQAAGASSGIGGGSQLGHGGRASTGTAGADPGSGSGSGGGGSYNNMGIGGAGTPGIILIEEYQL